MNYKKCYNFQDFRSLAKSKLPSPIFNYIDGAADDEVTYRRNTSSFDDVSLIPNVLRGVKDVDISTTVFGNGSGNTLDGSTAASLSVTPDAATDMLIFVGGVAQVAGTNYTYSGGAVTFGSAPPANDGTTNGHVIAIIHNLQKLGE